MIAKVLGYQGIATTRTVREHAASLALDLWLPWKDDRDSEWSYEHIPPERRRERTVVDPIYVVPQMLPCPDCRGFGCLACAEIASGTNREHGPCPNGCDSGVVAPPKPDYIATAEERHFYRDLTGRHPYAWHPVGACSGVEEDTERRQVVAYKVTATDELPVAEAPDDCPEGEHLVAYSDGTVYLCRYKTTTPRSDAWTRVPELRGLTPGRPVWRLHLEALDQPYTEMVIGHPESTRAAVPLSVPVGEVTEIELVELAR